MDNVKKMGDPQIFQEIGNAVVGIQQFKSGMVIAVVRVLEPQSGEHAEERTVHQQAFREVQDEMRTTVLREAVDQRLEIDTVIETRPAADADPRLSLTNPNG